ncbi:MAG: hypothetical protein PHY47_16000 [Lachnospiraceae bacterium]|nr:hypothetical protein [Lachnospiraceae bacterium]
MKLKNKSDCYLKKKVVNKGKDGEKYATYSDEPIKISVTVYSKSGQVQESQIGNVQQYQKKLLCDEPFTITNEDGVETYWFKDKSYSMAAGDGVCVYSTPQQEPDYKITAIYPVGHLKILLEKI